jgi:hypothetical protein
MEKNITLKPLLKKEKINLKNFNLLKIIFWYEKEH